MQARTSRDFGATIRTRRKTLGWTQADLALAVGVTRAWIISVEQGKASAEMSLVLRTLGALGLVANIELAPPAHGRIDLDQLLESPIRLAGWQGRPGGTRSEAEMGPANMKESRNA
jgi:y4mF family transcriptional regulator